MHVFVYGSKICKTTGRMLELQSVRRNILQVLHFDIHKWFRYVIQFGSYQCSIYGDSLSIKLTANTIVLLSGDTFALLLYRPICDVPNWSLHTENFFRNLIKSNRNQIVFTIFCLIWNQTDVHLCSKSISAW